MDFSYQSSQAFQPYLKITKGTASKRVSVDVAVTDSFAIGDEHANATGVLGLKDAIPYGAQDDLEWYQCSKCIIMYFADKRVYEYVENTLEVAANCTDTKTWAMSQPNLFAYYRFAPDKPSSKDRPSCSQSTNNAGCKAPLELDESGNGNDATLMPKVPTLKGASTYTPWTTSTSKTLVNHTYSPDCAGPRRFGYFVDGNEYEPHYFGRAVPAINTSYTHPSITVGGSLRVHQFEQYDTEKSFLATITSGYYDVAQVSTGYSLIVKNSGGLFGNEGGDGDVPGKVVIFGYTGPVNGYQETVSQELTDAWDFTPAPYVRQKLSPPTLLVNSSGETLMEGFPRWHQRPSPRNGGGAVLPKQCGLSRGSVANYRVCKG